MVFTLLHGDGCSVCVRRLHALHQPLCSPCGRDTLSLLPEREPGCYVTETCVWSVCLAGYLFTIPIRSDL